MDDSKFGLPNFKIGQIPSLGTTYSDKCDGVCLYRATVKHPVITKLLSASGSRHYLVTTTATLC